MCVLRYYVYNVYLLQSSSFSAGKSFQMIKNWPEQYAWWLQGTLNPVWEKRKEEKEEKEEKKQEKKEEEEEKGQVNLPFFLTLFLFF